MDLNVLSDLIGSIGFPIVACIYLAWSNEQQNKVLTQFVETLKSIDVRLQTLEKDRD